MTLKIKIRPFSLKDSLECGQFFRYTKVNGTYLVQSADRIFLLWQKGDTLFSEGISEDFLIRFFRLEDDLEGILREIDCDPIIHQAIQRYQGLRLIRQDPWECLLSFVCSSAKRVEQIRCIVESLCRCSGKKITSENIIAYGFPEPNHIKDVRQLAGINAGFRAPYLLCVSRQMDRERLLTLKTMSYKEARESLMLLSGIGKKIADCVLLYSLDFLEAFPIDTWMKKGLQTIYFGGRQIGERGIEKFVVDHFGPYAGYAQLYLFHLWRQDPRSLKKRASSSLPIPRATKNKRGMSDPEAMPMA